jgi:putative spermidine/putrescine transport system ATP-binding protein
MLKRDGRHFTVRPEKIRLLDDGAAPAPGEHAEGGTIADVAYAGMVTRYVVALDAGGELQVVRQNLETTSVDALEDRGRKVRVAWRPEQAYAIEDGPPDQEEA